MLPSAGRLAVNGASAERERTATRRRPTRRRRQRRATIVSARAFRIALIAPVLAFALALIGLHTPPGLDLPPNAPPTFDGKETLGLAALLVATGDRTPGGRGDAAAAGIISAQLADAAGTPPSVDKFAAPGRDGSVVPMVNLVSVLRGGSSEAIVVLARRDGSTPHGDPPSAVGTAAVIELARTFATQQHGRAIVVASVDGGTVGDAGARRLLRRFPRGLTPVAVIAVDGIAAGSAPLTIADRGDGRGRTHAGLIKSVEEALAAVPDSGGWSRQSLDGELLDLIAPPRTPGGQAPFIDRGRAAVEIGSGRTARGLPDPKRLAAVGQALNDLILSLDAGSSPAGPTGGYLRLGDRFLSGWLVALVCAALVAAPLLAGGELIARGVRGGLPVRAVAQRCLVYALPGIGLVLALVAAAAVGLVPSRPWDPPFTQHDSGMGWRGVAIVVAGVAAGAAAARFTPAFVPAADPAERAITALGAALAVGAGGAVFAIAATPIVGALLVPALYGWVFLERVSRGGAIARAAVIWAPLLLPWALVIAGRHLSLGEVGRLVADGRMPVAAALGTIATVAAATLLSATFIRPSRRVG